MIIGPSIAVIIFSILISLKVTSATNFSSAISLRRRRDRQAVLQLTLIVASFLIGYIPYIGKYCIVFELIFRLCGCWVEVEIGGLGKFKMSKTRTKNEHTLLILLSSRRPTTQSWYGDHLDQTYIFVAVAKVTSDHVKSGINTEWFHLPIKTLIYKPSFYTNSFSEMISHPFVKRRFVRNENLYLRDSYRTHLKPYLCLIPVH